jgi:hypothetical protein
MNTIVAYFNIEYPCSSHTPGHQRLPTGNSAPVTDNDSDQEMD